VRIRLRSIAVVLCTGIALLGLQAQPANAAPESLSGFSWLLSNHGAACAVAGSNGQAYAADCADSIYEEWAQTTNSNAVFNIVNHSNFLCLDVGPGPGYRVGLAPCHYESSYTSQKWWPQYAEQYHGQELRNGATGLCLDWSSIDNPLVLTRCHPYQFYTSQDWEGQVFGA
jgi:hypothetical protein